MPERNKTARNAGGIPATPKRQRPQEDWQTALNKEIVENLRRAVGHGTRAADALQSLVAGGCDQHMLGHQLSEVRSANGKPAATPKQMARDARVARRAADLMRKINHESNPRVSPLALLRVRMREIGDRQASRKGNHATARERQELDRLSQIHDSLLHAPEVIEEWANLVGAREDGPCGWPSVSVPMTEGVREGRWIRYGPKGKLPPGSHRLWVPASSPQSRKVFVPDARRRALPDQLTALETALVDYVKRKTAAEHYQEVAVLLLAFKRDLRAPSSTEVRKETGRLKQQTNRQRSRTE